MSVCLCVCLAAPSCTVHYTSTNRHRNTHRRTTSTTSSIQTDWQTQSYPDWVTLTWSIVKSQHTERTDYSDSRSVHWHEDHRLLMITTSISRRHSTRHLTHQYTQLAMTAHGAYNQPPLKKLKLKPDNVLHGKPSQNYGVSPDQVSQFYLQPISEHTLP